MNVKRKGPGRACDRPRVVVSMHDDHAGRTACATPSILVFLSLILSLQAPGGRSPGSPLDSLPKNIEPLTHFGERADFSPDNQRVAFMAKSFGDAFVIDLKTRVIRCLTCNVPGAAFLRVMHLVDGDYMLIGAEQFKDIRTSRGRDNEFWFLSQKPGRSPCGWGRR